jgi:hypothetical protein
VTTSRRIPLCFITASAVASVGSAIRFTTFPGPPTRMEASFMMFAVFAQQPFA